MLPGLHYRLQYPGYSDCNFLDVFMSSILHPWQCSFLHIGFMKSIFLHIANAQRQSGSLMLRAFVDGKATRTRSAGKWLPR